jgi:hypothetical protein
VAGVSGLTWGDVTPTSTPHLWSLAQDSALGALLIRGVYQRTCATDAWLTIGAGGRAVAPRVERPDGDLGCTAPPTPEPDGSAWQVPGWPAIVAENEDRYAPPFGVLSDSLTAAGECSTAVGPGAALMLADASGAVSSYLQSPASVTSDVLGRCAVTAVDFGEITPLRRTLPERDDRSGALGLATTRAAALRAFDDGLAALMAEMPADATLLVVTTADETALARLRVLTAAGPGGGGVTYGPGLLSTTSTRVPGLVPVTDLTPMVLNAAGAPPTETIVGIAPTVTGPSDLAARVDAVRQLDKRALAMVQITFPVNQAIVLGALLMYLVFGLVGYLRSRRRRQAGLPPLASTRLRRWLQIASLFVAAVPVSTFLANLVPWWRLVDGTYATRATATMVAIAVALALVLTWASCRLPWLRQPYRPVTFIASTTLAVLTADVMTGSHLQFATVLGLSPIAGGRFYGFGNVAFSVFAASAVFATVGLTAPLLREGRRRAASLVTAGIGLTIALIDGWPTFGADFGGMVALVVGFGLFAALVSAKGISWSRGLLVVGAAVAFAAAVSFVDYLRPVESRTHLGEFVASVIDGDATTTVTRKLSASLSSLTFSRVAPLIPVVWAVLGWVVLQPKRFRAAALEAACLAVPSLRAGLLAGLAIAGLGALVNDSGLIVTATMLGVGVPLAVAAAADPGMPPTAPATPGTPPEPPHRAVST